MTAEVSRDRPDGRLPPWPRQGFDDAVATGRAPTLILDVDGTLYDRDCPLTACLRARLLRLVSEVTGLSGPAAQARFDAYTGRYGLVVIGLHVEYGRDLGELFRRAHDVDLDRFLRPDAALITALGTCRWPKLAFSNAPRDHVDRVLDRLGVTRLIDGRVTIDDFSPYAKPDTRAFAALARTAGVSYPEMVLLDDNPRIVNAARRLGVRAGLVGPWRGGLADGAARFADVPAAWRRIRDSNS